MLFEALRLLFKWLGFVIMIGLADKAHAFVCGLVDCEACS